MPERYRLLRGLSAALVFLAAVGHLSASAPVQAQTQAQPTPAAATTYPRDIPAPDQPGAIPLRPAPRKALPEQWDEPFANQRSVRNVVVPTLTPFLPDPAKSTGAAMIVAPGGGFRVLMMDGEGYQVAQWLADQGVAAFVLKYRTMPMPRERAEFDAAYRAVLMSIFKISGPIDATPEAIEDGQAAIRLVRSRAAEWQVDPAKVGFIGFSAGAITALAVGTAPDPASRPDFIAPIYPQMLARPVPGDAPPMFLAIAFDDPLFAKQGGLGLIQAWRDAGRPVEAHLYGSGGHGFAMIRRNAATALWTDQLLAWMKDRRIIRK